MWVFVQLPVTLTPCRDDHWSSACIMQIWMKTDGVPLAHVHPHVTLIPCRDRLWRSVVSDRIYLIMRAAKGSPYRGSIIVFGHHGRSESAPTHCLTIYVRLSAGCQRQPLQGFFNCVWSSRALGKRPCTLFNHICTVICGLPKAVPTLLSTF